MIILHYIKQLRRDVINRKAASGAGDAASNGEVGENSGGQHQDKDANVTYGDFIPMTPQPDDKPEINSDSQEQPNVLYAELTLHPTNDDI